MIQEAEQILPEIIHRIVTRVHPEKIVLFGSHARGNASKYSDLDLLVILPFDEGQRWKIANEVDLSLFGITFPTDVLVATPEEVEAGRRQFWTVYKPAMEEGRTLYERTGNSVRPQMG